MAATPQYCQFQAKGLQSGKTYSIDAYVSDVNGALINFDAGAGAGSGTPTYYIPNEDIVIYDWMMHTGTADTEKIRICKGNKPTENVLRYLAHLDTLATRPRLQIGIRKGIMLTAFQISD